MLCLKTVDVCLLYLLSFKSFECFPKVSRENIITIVRNMIVLFKSKAFEETVRIS